MQNETSKTTEVMTTKEVRNMVRGWLTGNNEADAQMLKRTFRALRFSIGQWRQVVSETLTMD